MYDDDENSHAWEAAKSGAGSGALLGALGSVVAGKKRLPQLLKAALAGGLSGGALSGGGTAIGESLLGSPSEDEHGGYTRRAGLGGVVGGGLIGGGLGALIGSGKLRGLMKIPEIAKALAPEGGLDNLVTDYFKKFAGSPAKSALLGAGALGAAGGVYGSSEGMQTDYLQGTAADERKKKRLAMMQAMGVL